MQSAAKQRRLLRCSRGIRNGARRRVRAAGRHGKQNNTAVVAQQAIALGSVAILVRTDSNSEQLAIERQLSLSGTMSNATQTTSW